MKRNQCALYVFFLLRLYLLQTYQRLLNWLEEWKHQKILYKDFGGQQWHLPQLWASGRYTETALFAEGLKEVFLGIWEKTWGENTVIIGRAAEILPFFNGDVCLGTVIEVCTEGENGFGEKLVEELGFNDIREVLDKGFPVLKYETVIEEHLSQS